MATGNLRLPRKRPVHRPRLRAVTFRVALVMSFWTTHSRAYCVHTTRLARSLYLQRRDLDCGYRNSSNLFATKSDSDPNVREELLHQSLRTLQIDTVGLADAALQSIHDPTSGYDGRFGKSAIKAYRAFLYPKKIDSAQTPLDALQLPATADRVARQIEFLYKRHQSHQAEWVRHHDSAEAISRHIFPIVLLLDNLRSAMNVGSLFRTADATGCAQVWTTGITPHPFGAGAEKLHKSALGAQLIVPSRHFSTTRDAIRYARDTLPEYQVIGMETTTRSRVYTDLEYSPKGAILVLGNEVTGVDTTLMDEMDVIVEIPMFGAKNSLNVAACAPVVLYELLRQWKVAGTIGETPREAG